MHCAEKIFSFIRNYAQFLSLSEQKPVKWNVSTEDETNLVLTDTAVNETSKSLLFSYTRAFGFRSC